MNKAEQQELKTLVAALESRPYYMSAKIGTFHISIDSDFQRLKQMATMERFTDVQPKPLSSLTFSQLAEMYEYTDVIGDKIQGELVWEAIRSEMKNRLLNLIPYEKS